MTIHERVSDQIAPPLPRRSTGDAESVPDGLPGIPSPPCLVDRIGHEAGHRFAGLGEVGQPAQRVSGAVNLPGEPASHGGTRNRTARSRVARQGSGSHLGNPSVVAAPVAPGHSIRSGSSLTSTSSIPYVSSPPDAGEDTDR